MLTEPRRLDIEEVDGITVVKFVDKKILDEGDIRNVGKQLFALVDEAGGQKIILDFDQVEFLSSTALGTLIRLEGMVKKANSKLRLCSIRPEIFEVFEITRLDQKFNIKPTLEEALEDF